jgi:Domain of unknown function (DUF4136)
MEYAVLVAIMTLVRYICIVLLAASCIAFAGCAPRVLVEQDSSAQFSGLHSFIWANPPVGKVRDPILDSQILEQRVQRAVVADLLSRGYIQTTTENKPDFTVTYHIIGKQQLQSSGPSFSFGFFGAYPNGFGSVAVPVDNGLETREQGTLILDIIDNHTKQLVWRGWISDWVNQDNYSEKAISQAVKAILDKFPSESAS